MDVKMVVGSKMWGVPHKQHIHTHIYIYTIFNAYVTHTILLMIYLIFKYRQYYI